MARCQSSDQPAAKASPAPQRYRWLGLLMLAPLLLARTLAPTLAYADEEAGEVAVTLPPLAGLVAMLDPDVSVFCLLRQGADPHDFRLRPHDIESLRQARLLLRASKDDLGWPIPPHHANTLDLWPTTSHAWLSPAAVKKALPILAEKLARLHPEHASAIAGNLSAAIAQTTRIAQQWRQLLAGVGGVIMQHPSWKPLMIEIGVPVLDVLESARHGHEAGPRKLEHALQTLNEHPDAWLVGDAAHGNKALDWLARHAAQTPRRVTLDPLGRCGEAWPELMRRNIERFAARIPSAESARRHP